MKEDDFDSLETESDPSLDLFARSLIMAGRKPRTFASSEKGWVNFAARMSFTAGCVEPVSAVRPLPTGSHESPPATLVSPPPAILIPGASGSLVGQSLKLLVLGSLVGGATVGGLWLALDAGEVNAPPRPNSGVAAALQSATTPPSVDESPQSVATRQPVGTPKTVAETPAMEEPYSPPPSTITPSLQRGNSDSLNTDRAGPNIKHVTQKEGQERSTELSSVHNHSLPAPSTLAEQARLLDEARRANPARALNLITTFHSEYPTSPLRADAEVVFMGALRSLGMTHALTARARAFLVSYPNDPHATRVRNWLEE